uniref:integrase core domain-containing protein n=1 Tax=Corynebacterium macginleyi TaxID=38290 RepID=UPI002D806CB4|nr:integrase core domain-containing protein [Corynebacterium macginleyi]
MSLCRLGTYTQTIRHSLGEVELASLRWVHWWNTKRLHEALDYATPQEVETEYYLT